jgi:hypothetical protein
MLELSKYEMLDVLKDKCDWYKFRLTRLNETDSSDIEEKICIEYSLSYLEEFVNDMEVRLHCDYLNQLNLNK